MSNTKKRKKNIKKVVGTSYTVTDAVSSIGLNDSDKITINSGNINTSTFDNSGWINNNAWNNNVSPDCWDGIKMESAPFKTMKDTPDVRRRNMADSIIPALMALVRILADKAGDPDLEKLALDPDYFRYFKYADDLIQKSDNKEYNERIAIYKNLLMLPQSIMEDIFPDGFQNKSKDESDEDE